jgi:hypothetical protein
MIVLIKKNMNNIFKFCEKKNCENAVQYNKLKTGFNDPHMSKQMLIAQQANNYSRSRSTVDVSPEICLNIKIRAQQKIKPESFVCNNPVFTGGIYPSRNVSKCSCSRTNLANIILGK